MFFLQYLFCIFFPWRCRIITQIVSKCHDRANLLPNLQKFRIIEKISTKYTIIPPNMFIIFWDFSTQYGYSIPYVYFSGANVHPIRLFHTLRLLDTLEYLIFWIFQNSDKKFDKKLSKAHGRSYCW